MYADSAYNLRILLTICGFHDSYAFHGNLSLLNLHIIFCLLIPQTVPDSANFFSVCANFVAGSAKLLVFGAIFSNPVFQLFVREMQNSTEDQRKIAMSLAIHRKHNLAS